MTLNLKALMKEALEARGAVLEKPSPIPCLGYEIHTSDAHEYDCRYEYAGAFGCEDCIVNGGRMDPRTGKKTRRKRT